MLLCMLMWLLLSLWMLKWLFFVIVAVAVDVDMLLVVVVVDVEVFVERSPNLPYELKDHCDGSLIHKAN